MTIGIGTDLLHIDTIRLSVADPNEPFVKKTYTEKELALIYSRPAPLYCFATRFAGKEAVFKCFQTHGDAFRLNDIEILEDENGVPVVHLHGKAESLAKQKGISHILISLSFDRDYALAFAEAVGNDR